MTSEAPAAPEEWRRTSPRSFVVGAITGLRNLLFPVAAVLFGSQGWGGAIFVFASIALMVLFSSLFTYIGWRHLQRCQLLGVQLADTNGQVRQRPQELERELAQPAGTDEQDP